MNAGSKQSALDVKAVRAEFPALQQVDPATGDRFVFLDSAASSQKPRQVIDAMRSVYEHNYANVHRGVYRWAAECTALFEKARESVRAFISASTPREVVFTRGTTEAINLVVSTWGEANVGAGDVVLLSQLEHHSNLVPWQQLASRKGAKLRFIPVDDTGALDLASMDEFAREGQLRIVSVAHVSNALGTVNDIQEISAKAKAHGATVMVDGAQGAPHRQVDVQQLGCDFYAFSGHKACGPTGIGVLWGKESVLSEMPPWQFGGEMIRRVEFDNTTFNDLPWKFEAGTPAFVEAIGLGVALDYLMAIGMDAIHAHDVEIASYAYDRISSIDGVHIHGPGGSVDRGGIVSFTMDFAHPHDIASILDSRGVCIRAGHHCAQPLMRKMGLSATARASTYIYTDTDDVDRLVAALGDVQKMFG